jgi:imidazolonepropionase-like amidohydrolase
MLSAYRIAVAAVGALRSAGVSICVGMLANDIGVLAVSFGDGIYEELEVLVQAGLSNIEALRAATSEPAHAFGLSDRGMLEAGRRPDLILLRGNPLNDLSAVRYTKRVWLNGVEFGRNV